jgi:murein DD-endopeptidase MepM/ murein hydrolase activator NlpD
MPTSRREFRRAFKISAGTEIALAATPSIWPVRGWVTSEFGTRDNPFGSGPNFTKGSTLPREWAKKSRRRRRPGVEVAYRSDDGNIVKIDHGHGVVTSYAHLSKRRQTGSADKTGDVLGFVGDTGRSTGPRTLRRLCQ